MTTEKQWTKQIRIGGEAGQGVILAGVKLAEIAVDDGYEVGQSARYGAAVRGGDATADVVISNAPIDFPLVEQPDYLVVLSQPTYNQYAPAQADGTLLLYDPFFVQPAARPALRQVSIPATEIALRELGNATGANVIVLAALTELSGAVSLARLQAAFEREKNPKFKAANLRAVALGLALASAAKEGR